MSALGNPTPGDWEFVGLLIGGPNSELVATVTKYYSDEARNIANARLIAASPTLLAALAPFAVIEGEGDEDFPDDTSVTLTFGRTTANVLTLGDLRRARAAVTKASGPA